MNNKYFRVIFSKVLNCLVVVSELAKSEGKDNKKCGGILQPFFHFLGKLKPVAFCFFCALGFVTFTTHTLAETLIIQADKAAPKNQQPIILHTANGLPQVNIQTPNAQGLSHNKYTKFDVDTKGAILNNSASNVKTQQAGWIQANPYLAKGEAKVILNEVNSHDPSILKGYVEVAGKKADVIIANPSGLHCEGCGIINAHRATFTTGQAQINNGHLEGFVVAKGRVTVSGKGLDNSKVDYTEILAREVQANAGIWSKKELKVATGKNHIKRTSAEENLQILHTQEENSAENAPHFAIDVGELGGMYAGKIHLIGTENGVGVRNAGHIGASAETLKIDSQGRIVNTGTLNSHQALDLTATKSIENKGKIENRQGDIQLNTKADIKQDGSVVARQGNIHKQAAKAITQQGETVAKGDIRYTASSVDASTSSLIAAGVNVKDSEKGEVRELENQSAQGKSIQITTSNKSTLQGKNIAPNKVQVQATEVNLDHSQNSAHTIEVKASKGKIQANGATIIANREIKLTTPTLLETQNSHLKAEKLTTKQRSLNIKNATWEQTGKDELVLNVVDTLQNSGGTFSTQGDFTVKANGIDNQGGRLLAQGKITIDAAQGKVDSSGGVVYSPKTINILSGELVNNSGLIQSGQNITLNTQGKGLSNNNTLTDNQSKGIVALGMLQIHSANLVNQQGRIVSGGQQQLNISDMNNQQGLIYTQEALSLNSTNIKNDKGQIKAAKQADLIISDDLRQQNGVVEADVLNLSAHNIDSRDESQIVANRTTISVENQLVNSNSLIQADKEALTLQAARLDNTKGRMIAKKAQLDLKARVQFNNLQGSVWTNNKLNMNVGKFVNQQGTLYSEQDLNLTATQLENNQGTISSNTNSSLKIKNAMSQEAGHILSSGVLSIHADQLHSTNKSVISGNQVNVATGQMVNKASQLLAKQAMTISSQALDNTQGEISSQHNAVTIDTHQQKLDNTQGKIRSTLALSIQSGELDNSQGAVHSESDILLNTHQQKLINQHTLSAEKGIIALGQLTLQSGVFNNQQGYLASRLDQSLTVSDFNNTQGLIKANQKLKLVAEGIQNHYGLISAKTAANISVANQFMQRNGQLGADELTLNTARLSNEQGSLIAATSANIQIAGQLSNTQSRINTVNDLIIKSQQLNNSLGVINSRDGNMDIHTQQHQLDNTKGHMTAKGNLTLTAGELNNTEGAISAESVKLNVNALSNRLGVLQSRQLSLDSERIENSSGLILGTKQVTLTAREGLQQQAGKIGAGELTLNVGELSSSEKSVIVADNAILAVKKNLTNTDSEISATDHLTITSQVLNNQLGLLLAEKGNLKLNTQQQKLNNLQGKLVAGQTLSVESGALDNQQGLIQGKERVSLNTHHQALNNGLGNILSQQELTISAGELTNQQGYIQSQQQATIDLGSSALQNQNGTLSTDADLRLTAGTIHNDNGKIVAKQHINADIANLYQHNGTVKAEQQLNLSASGEILSKNHSQLIGENLNIRTNGQLDNQQSEIVAQQSVTLRSAKLNNNNGVLIAEQGNLEIDTQQQSLTNQQGKLSAGANLTLNSGLLDNQQGLIQSRQNMMINTHQGNLNNQQTKIDPQRKQNQGIIALGELVLTTQQLLNQQGYLLSKGQQTLNTQSIENGEGVIASLANQNISVSQHIGNVLGRISGNATTIKAQSVDNQSGLLQGEHSLNVKVTETLNNQNGQIKADELLDAKAKIIHNREGQMRAVNGALSLSSQQKLDNRLGNISAKSQAMIKAKGINNQQGLIYNEQGGLELNLQQQALENQQGNVIAKATLNVESGSITNHNGAIYAEHLGTLKVDGVVDNQHNGKIHGLGEMQIQANQIDNRGGEIRTQNKLTLDVATDINNQKVSGMGSFIESGDKLIINAAQINNSQTKSNTEKMHQGILASHLTISAQSLNNQRGKIHSQETSNFVIQQNLDNRQGDVTGSGSVSITGEQSNLNNQDGRLQADTLLVISANEVTTNGHIEGQDVQIRQKQDFVTGQHINADRSLAITTDGNLTNRHHLYADESVTLNAQHISNQVDARISSANTQLNAKGNLTNEGLINSISPEDNAKTVIKVGGTLLNTGKGRIYGDDIALQADRIENSDKDYGNGEIKSAVVAARGRLDLAAREMDNNTAHYLSDNQIGATLFSVGNMTFGRTLNAENRAEGKAEILRNNSSLIESERHIALNVAQVTNSNPHLMVHHLINGKEGDEITRIKGSEKAINQEYIIPYNGQNLPAAFENQKGAEKGSLSAENDTYISMKNLVWVSWSRAGQLVYNLNNVEPTLLKAGDQITEDMLLASRNQMRCDGYESSTSHCHYIPAGQYEIDSPIWAYANATPPTKSSPVFSFDELAAQPWYKEEEWFSVDPKTKELDQFIAPPKPIEPTQPIRGATETDNDFQARTESYQQALVNYHQAKEKWDFYQTKIKPYNDWVTENAEAIEKVDEKILAHNQALRQKLGQAYFRNFWLIKLKQSQEDESKVIQTLPGQILAAGNLTFDGNRLINDRSTVIAGEKLNLIGTVENRDQEGLHRLTESGSSQYTKERWRGGFKRYHQREWGRVNDYKRIIETPFDMHVYRLEDKVNYVQNSRISEEMKEKTPHSLTLTNVSATTDALRATANQGLGELNGTLSGDFTELTSSERDIDHIDTQDIKGQEVHTTNVKEELTAFQDVRASRLNGLASSGIAPQNEIKAPKTTTTRPLERLVLNDNQEVRSIEPNVVIPQNVLYRVNAEPDSKVLIETDPDFTDKRRWLSSDYMFNALRYEPNATQKRLGDGFYEQRLVREQINRLTGRQFLGNSRDFDSQYKALMDAGISFAQKFNLRPGIALSSAQVAQLTSDIVWFEKQMVTLPDGNQSAVLVPRVYALVKKGDITSNGSLLSGSHVYHQGGEFINSGTVSGRALVQFDSDSIRNTGNISGGAVVGKVRGDVENIGGTIEADRAILLDIAGDFTHRSTTHTTEVNEKGYQRRDTTLGRKGLLYVKGEEGVLQLSANNINLAGAGIINDGKGQTSLSAKSQLNLSALSVGFDEKMGEGNHYRNEKVQGVAISHIQGKGDVVLSGRDIYSEGAEVDAKGRLALLAENEIVLGTASQQREYEEYHKTKKRNVFATSTKESYQQSTAKIEKGSQIQGQSVLLQSKGTTTLVGTNMLATNNLVIKAQQGILLANAENYLTQHEWEKQKKSGFMLEKSAGSMRIGFGVSRAKDKDNHQSTQVVSSQLQSLAGNINVVSQKGDVSGNAAILDAGKDIYLQGKNIALKAATETQIKEHQSALKSASMGIGMTYKPKATFKQAYGEQEGQGSAGSAVGKLITAGEALDKTSHKVTQQFAPYVSAKASQSTHQEQHNNAVVSQLNAGGKLSLIATEGNLSTEGALLSAKEDGTLWAKQDIDLGVALSTQSQSAKGTRIGFDFDASRRPTDVVGKYLGKEQGEGESEKQHASVLSFGGKGSITAKEGNLTLLGSQVVANDNVSLSAGKNIRLATSVDSIAQGDSNTFHGMGEAVVSETERFSGYNRKLGNQEGKQTTHTGASIASLKSNVDIYAGKDLHQTSAQVLAKNHINISAENVIADTAYNSTSHNSHQSDLKVGMFARVISPIIDLVNSVEKSVKDKEASDRVKAAQLMGLAAQGYNLNHALNHDDKAVLFRAEMGVGLAHSRQQQTGANQESIGNQLNAKEINVEARHGNLMAMQTDFTSRDEKGERIAGSHINLSAKENIELYAGKSHYRQQGKNQSYGTEVGTAFSVGAKTGWSFYAKEGFSKGKQESEGKTYHNSHIDTDTLTLSSGKDTALIGATAKAKTIYADIKGHLHIESQQDEHKQNSKQFGLGTKVEFGFGSAWEFSGNASAEGGKSNSKQVNEQAGLFAEEGGYHISADNVHLKGGVIASTNAKNSELTTNKLTFEDINNSANYGATSGAISGGYSQSGTSVNPSLPMHEQGEDSTTTKATLTEGKITLNKDSQATETTAAALGINTDISQANRQVEQPKDVNQLLKEQKEISANVGHIATAATNFSHRQAKDLEEEAKEAEKAGDYQTAKAKREEAKSWETGGKNKRKVDAITTALSLALAGQSPQAIATGAASPYINQAIKNITEEIPELNIPAHILWGAIEAELTGGKAATGAIAAGVGELSAPILSQALYGNKKTNELTDAEKQQVLNLSKLVAGIASGLTATGNSAENLVTISQGMKIADNAVENNALNASQSVDYLKELSDAIAQGKSLDEINEKYKSISQAEFEKDLQACNQQGLMCYVGTLMAMDAGIKSAEGYKNFYPLPPDIQAQALDFVRNEAARHSIELVDGSPTMIQLALMAIEVGQEMYEAKNAGRSFAADRAQANFAKKTKDVKQKIRITKKPVFKTDSDAAKVAKDLGYTKTNYRTKSGAAVFKKGTSYITRDVDGHNGGAWKEASSPEKLNSKDTRNGTFDINLNKIGD